MFLHTFRAVKLSIETNAINQKVFLKNLKVLV
jgi:hypothetical protein